MSPPAARRSYWWGKRFILPEQIAYMTKFCLAELRDQGLPLTPGEVTFVREQGAIPFALKNNLSHIGGIASYSGVAGRLQKEGLRVLHKKPPAAVPAAHRRCQDFGRQGA